MFRSSIILTIVGLALALAIAPAAAQAPKPEEISSSVPALDAMHEVIMPMWHEAWPNKDYKALAALVPAIDKHVAAISKAELPRHPARQDAEVEGGRRRAIRVGNRLQGRRRLGQ